MRCTNRQREDMKSNTVIHRWIKAAACMLMAIITYSCEPYDDSFLMDVRTHGSNPGNRVPVANGRRVVLMYLAGFNSLSDCLRDDLNDVINSWLPQSGQKDNVLLVYTHQPKRDGLYSTQTTPYLLRLSADAEGNARIDTLKTYPKTSISASANQLNKVLTYVKDNFPATGYGMTFSSHATGYLPAGFYSKPDSYVFQENRLGTMSTEPGLPYAVPYYEPEHDPSLPRVRSIGQDQQGSFGSYVSYEMDLKDFADAIPMKLDFIMFDACLMGGIEVAYELQGKCGKVGFSQAEVLAEGLDYTGTTAHLLGGKTADLESICHDYFTYYDMQTDDLFRSATISLVDCDRLEPLAQVCREIFANHRDGLVSLKSNNVQRFFRSGKVWFYDLESIAINAGATDQELAALQEALDNCVIYKAHTPEFMCEFSIDTFSGFSMYLPKNGTPELNKYYRTLKWNEATGLVE